MRPWAACALAVAAISNAGCLTTTRTTTRVDTGHRETAIGAPDVTRDLVVRVLATDDASTRLLITSVGRCPTLSRRTDVGVVRQRTYLHPAWTIAVATVGGLAVSDHSSGDRNKIDGVGLVFAGALALAASLVPLSTSETRSAPQPVEQPMGWTACDVRPAPGARVAASTDGAPVVENTGVDGVVVLPVALARIRELSILGLRTLVR